MQYVVPYGGERLDRIAKKVLQTEREGTVEALLTANPGLALLASTIVPAGTTIMVPEDFAPARNANFTLAWE
ncbi:tail protein X [Rhizobium pusense]|uniref:tail protein X n=1 Tax=Agrobacterium pusense TaxID=648995 RepID=UPI00244B3060|nr:tail protein X [Agrobacterium pusense]MDH1097398.1 tail protein X [Agrobacterium pusense]MDH1111228.1 tail protein X [Agrobacterium pusense]MDH2193431.1 tail protein X [Agrobacterium pusense]